MYPVAEIYVKHSDPQNLSLHFLILNLYMHKKSSNTTLNDYILNKHGNLYINSFINVQTGKLGLHLVRHTNSFTAA